MLSPNSSKSWSEIGYPCWQHNAARTDDASARVRWPDFCPRTEKASLYSLIYIRLTTCDNTSRKTTQAFDGLLSKYCESLTYDKLCEESVIALRINLPSPNLAILGT